MLCQFGGSYPSGQVPVGQLAPVCELAGGAENVEYKRCVFVEPQFSQGCVPSLECRSRKVVMWPHLVH